MVDVAVFILLILYFVAQGCIAIGLLGIFISAFSDSFREKLTVFITLLFAGVVLYLTVYWTLVTIIVSYCPGGGC